MGGVDGMGPNSLIFRAFARVVSVRPLLRLQVRVRLESTAVHARGPSESKIAGAAWACRRHHDRFGCLLPS